MILLFNLLLFFFVPVSVISQPLVECDVIVTLNMSMSSRRCMEDLDYIGDDMFSVKYVCDQVETMLEAVANGTIETGLNCTELQIPSGFHVIRQNYTFTGKNLRIVKEDKATPGSAQIAFNTNQSIIESLVDLEPFYVIKIESTDFFEVNGLSFAWSPGIILVMNVSYVTFEDNEFLYFVESALDIYNCRYVKISNCTIKHSGHNANFLKGHRYSIHAGALSIAVHEFGEANISPSPYIEVSNCTFYNNSAIPSKLFSRTTNEIFSNQVFTGRGGALGIALNGPNNTIKVSVHECHFEENKVQLWGGGAYIIFGSDSNHTVTYNSSVFIRNRSDYGSGGLFIGTLSGGHQLRYTTCNVIDCDFIYNFALHGGGSVWPVPRAALDAGDRIFNRGSYKNCRFINNTASNIAGLSLVTADSYRTQLSHAPVEIIDCTFYGNNGGGTTPALSALYVPLIFLGYNKFDSNIGGAIQIVGSTAVLKGTLEIKNSNISDTQFGALTVSSLTQITLYKGSRMIFENNTGSIGAALVTEAVRISPVFASIAFNPLCSLLYEDLRASPDDWTDVEITFSGNRAIVGAAIFTSQLRVCSWTQFKNPTFNDSNVFKWSFIKFHDNENTFHDGDSKSSDFNVQTPGQTIKILNGNLSVYPGENFTMSAKVLDELGNSVFSAISTRDPQISDTDSHSSFVFDPSVHALKSKSQNISTIALVHFDFFSLDKINTVDIQSIENALHFEADILSTLGIQFNECPPGYFLQSQKQNLDFKLCKCNTNNFQIVTCTSGKILFEEKVWAMKDTNVKDHLFTFPCPTGYCKCEEEDVFNCYNTYDNANPDDQCISTRKGILCGECRSNNGGVSALLNHCVTCHDGFSILIPTLITLDVIVLVVLIRYFLCHQFPSWLLPCIFYIQFLPLGSLFFSDGFQLYRKYLLFVSSATSFYFPYDFCLYHNMDILVSYSLRFLPLVIVTITFIIMLIYCWRFVLLVRNRDWYLLWMVVLLIYQFTLYNAMTILDCPSIPTDDGRSGHWFVSGNIECFTGGHIPLGIFSIIIIILLVLLIPLTFVLSLKVFERPIWLKRIQRPLVFWFKDEYKWWFSVELARRFLIVLMIVPFNGYTYPVSVIYFISFAVFTYAQPYTSLSANILEVVFSVVTIMLYNFEGHLEFNALAVVHSPNQRPLLWFGGILYFIPLLVAICFVILHISLEVKKKVQKLKVNREVRRSVKEQRERNFSLADQIQTVSSTNVGISEKHGNNKIFSTVIEEDPSNKDGLKYSTEMLDIVVSK